MDFSALRALFPVTAGSVYLNNAAETPLNTRVRQKVEEFLTTASSTPHNPPSVRRPVKLALSELFGGAPEDYALVTSTGVGIGFASSGYPWQAGDNMVVPADEHLNNTLPWLALREQGVDVRLAPVEADGRVQPEKIAALVDERTRILATTAVRYNSGFRADLRRLGQIAHAQNALLLVDGVQAAGVCPLNVVDDGIDLLACAGYKWTLGMPGVGFFYINRAAREVIQPVLPGMFGAEEDFRELRYLPDARRYETGSIAYALFYGWTAGLEILKDVGIAQVYARALELAGCIINGLRAKGFEIVSPVEKVSERSAIVSFTAGSAQINEELVKKLAAEKIIVALRDGCIRVSPNFYNNEEDIDRFLAAV